jgi:hypothetical protein
MTESRPGTIAALSTFAIPGLLAVSVPPQMLASQWRVTFEIGKAAMPKFAIASLIGYAYAAFDAYQGGEEWTAFTVAGVLTAAIVPFTLIFMDATNTALIGIATGKTTTLSEEAVRGLVLKWKGLNFTRSLLPLAGSLVGFWRLLA